MPFEPPLRCTSCRRMSLLLSTPREEDASRRGDTALVLSIPVGEVGEPGQHIIDFQRPETKVLVESVIQAATCLHGKGILCIFQLSVYDNKRSRKQIAVRRGNRDIGRVDTR